MLTQLIQHQTIKILATAGLFLVLIIATTRNSIFQSSLWAYTLKTATFWTTRKSNGSSGEPTWCHDNLKILLPKPGFTELSQFYKTFTLTVSAMKYTSDHFDAIKNNIYYNVTWLQQHDCLAFFVSERRRSQAGLQRATRGGSVFHTIVVGRTSIDFCPYVDHGNDTYTVFCPLYESCVDVISHMTYFDYLGFWPDMEFNHRQANVMAFRQQVCHTSIATSSASKQAFLPRFKTPYWSRDGDGAGKAISYDMKWSPSFDWHLQLCDSASVPQITESMYNRCKDAISSLDFIGDSHVDMISLYAMNFEGAAELYGQSGIVTGTRGRLFAQSFLPELHKILQRLKRRAVTNKTAVVIADVGLHDVCHYSLKYVYQSVIPKLVKNLRRMQDDGLLDNVRLVLLGMSATPPSATPLSFHRVANSAAITAMNRLMADSLGRAGVNLTFVEYFELARQFINKTSYPLDHHYMNYNRTHTLGKRKMMYGKVGIELANYVISLACS